MNEVTRFFNSIEFNHKEYYETAKVLKVLLLKKQEIIEVYLHFHKPLPLAICEELLNCAQKGIYGKSACQLHLS